MDLREEIAAVIDSAGGRYEHADTDTITADVMGVVTSYLDGRRAYSERRVEWARRSEARVWKRQVEDADAEIAELEEENQKLRDDLNAATRFEIGKVTITRRSGGWHRCNWPIPKRITPPGSKSGGATTATENYSTRDAALARAREITKEER